MLHAGVPVRTTVVLQELVLQKKVPSQDKTLAPSGIITRPPPPPSPLSRVNRLHAAEPAQGRASGTCQRHLSRWEVALPSRSSQAEGFIRPRWPAPFQTTGLQPLPPRLWWEGGHWSRRSRWRGRGDPEMEGAGDPRMESLGCT